MYIYIYIYIRIHIYTAGRNCSDWSEDTQDGAIPWCMCMCMCIYIYIYVHIIYNTCVYRA